jgi:hypothetical protein
LVVGGALTITSLLAVFYRFRDFRRGRNVGVNA